MEIINFTNELLNDIVDIEKASFERPWTKKMFEDAGNKVAGGNTAGGYAVRFKAAVENGKTFGYCVYQILGDEAEILNIAVSPDLRKKGFGKAILEHILNDALKSGAKTVFLEVRESNAPAIGLYLSFGFEKFGTRKKYYISEDAILLRKNLQ